MVTENFPCIGNFKYPAKLAFPSKMVQIIKEKGSLVAIVTDSKSDHHARGSEQADALAKKHDLYIADLHTAIPAIADYPDIRKAVRKGHLTTTTGEYHGRRDAGFLSSKKFWSYEAGHGVGSLFTRKGVDDAIREGRYVRMDYVRAYEKDPGLKNIFTFLISPTEWAAIGRGQYKGQEIPRFHIYDIKRGDLPETGKPYTIYMDAEDLQEDAFTASRDDLDYDAFMRDDRILMLAGDLEKRETLAKMLFGAEKDGGEGLKSIRNWNRAGTAFLSEEGSGEGYLLRLGIGNRGLEPSDRYGRGRFLEVSKELATTPHSLEKLV